MRREELRRLRQVRERTLGMVGDLSQAEIDDSPADGWSVGQLLDHLRRADITYGGEIRRLIDLERAGQRPAINVGLAEMEFPVPWIPKSVLPFADVPTAIFNFVLPNRVREFFLRNPIVPAESPPVLKPEAGHSKEELVQGLRESLSQTERLFLGNPDLRFEEFRYYHPLFGYNNAYDILRLLISHEERHQEQLRKMLAHASAAKLG